MPTTFLSYTCLTEPVCNFEEGKMTSVSNAGEKLSATHLPSYKIARPIFLKHNFAILILAQNFLRSPCIPCLKPMLSKLPPVASFKKHPSDKAKLVHFCNFSHHVQWLRMTFIQILIVSQDSVQALSHS